MRDDEVWRLGTCQSELERSDNCGGVGVVSVTEASSKTRPRDWQRLMIGRTNEIVFITLLAAHSEKCDEARNTSFHLALDSGLASTGGVLWSCVLPLRRIAAAQVVESSEKDRKGEVLEVHESSLVAVCVSED